MNIHMQRHSWVVLTSVADMDQRLCQIVCMVEVLHLSDQPLFRLQCERWCWIVGEEGATKATKIKLLRLTDCYAPPHFHMICTLFIDGVKHGSLATIAAAQPHK